jgi:hypothetical protein
MNKILIAALIATFATSAGAKTIYYPAAACTEILSSEYSTGGGNTAWEMFEILCRDVDGKYTAFVTSWASVAGFLGFGRLAHEEVITLVPHNGNKLKVD